VNFYSIAGDADGNPTGTAAPQTLAEGGKDPASLGGNKSISVEFAAPSTTSLSQVGSPVIVAGVPQNKTQEGTGTDGFTVSIAGSNPLVQSNYVSTIPWANGNLAFDPSPAHPDFEFSIKDWSAFKNLAGPNGFWVSAYAGSPDDVVAGESNIPWVHIAIPQQQTVPEPTAVAGWALMGLGAAWALRRSRRATNRA
jgi:MYXO-CTERM domain-containing protein